MGNWKNRLWKAKAVNVINVFRFMVGLILAISLLSACISADKLHNMEARMLDLGSTMLAESTGTLKLTDQGQVRCFMKKLRTLAPAFDLSDSIIESFRIKQTLSNRRMKIEFTYLNTEYTASGYLVSDDLLGVRDGIEFYPIEITSLSNTIGPLSVNIQQNLWDHVDPVLQHLSAAAQRECSMVIG